MRRHASALVAALALALAVAGGACGDPAPPAPAKTRVKPTPTEVPGEADGCRDWSTLDVSQLAPLTEGKHAALLDEVWRRVLEKHFDPTLGCLDWAALRLVYAQRIAEAANDRQAYGHINAMLDELGQSHLRLFPPGRSEQDAMGPVSPALTVRWIEEQLVVVRSTAEGPQGPVLPGATLLAIDDVPVGKLIADARARHEPHAFPQMIARRVAARLSCEREGQNHKLKVTNPAKDQRHAIRIVPCLAPEGERITLGNLRDVPTRVEYSMLEGTAIGVLRFNVWMLPMVKRMQAGMEALRAAGMRALVLDLRGNPGGVGAMAVPVARMLLTSEGSLGTMRFRDFEQVLRVEPGMDAAFEGPVVVLVDESTASTSEIFVLGLRELGRITVVGGRASAGAALPSVIEELEGGALLQYVVADYHSPQGRVVEGKGIEPDIVVNESRRDFALGRDAVVEAAREHLEQALESLPPVEGQGDDRGTDAGAAAKGRSG